MDKKYEYNSPLVYQRADPFVYLHTDGYYYFTGTMPQYDCIEIRRAKTLNGLLTADSEVVCGIFISPPVTQKTYGKSDRICLCARTKIL